MLFDECATENRRRSIATLPSAASQSRHVRALVRAVMSCLPRAGAPYRHLCLLGRRDRDGVVRATDIARWWVPARQADEIGANLVTGRETGPEEYVRPAALRSAHASTSGTSAPVISYSSESEPFQKQTR
jgi:hypothetical protein